MKAQDLIKNEIYKNLLDIEIPLKFTGEIKKNNNFGITSYIAFFEPVETEKNKNWYNSIKKISKRFDVENGNDYITK